MDASLRDQLERVTRESRSLKHRADLLEKENAALKKSIYDLSVKYNLLAYQHHAAPQPLHLTAPVAPTTSAAPAAAPGTATVFGGAAGTGGSDGPGMASAAGAPVLSTSAAAAPAAATAAGESPSGVDATGSTGASSTTAVVNSGLSSVTNGVAAVSLSDGTSMVVPPPGPPGGPMAGTSAAHQVLMENMSSSSRDKHKDGKFFSLKTDLKGHSGAVYTVQFSPCGRFLASGSFDKTVRIWDAASAPKELHVLKRHTVNISELCWSSTSRELVSGAYDQTCKLWDTEHGKLISSYECEGFVQCVQFNPADNHQFIHGSTRKVLGVTDKRLEVPALTIRTDAMVNSVYVYQDGSHVLSGDSLGQLKLWDLRNAGQCVETVVNEPARKPISHLAVSAIRGGEEPRYMAVNSYDNVIRVYDRGFAPPRSQTRLMHSLKGHKNKNWPIKSAFYNQSDFVISTFPRTVTASDRDILDTSMDTGKEVEEPAMLLATGSADPFAYLYAVGTSEGQTEMVQRLEGHSDRVYSVAFHPTEALLATCSADFTIKVWASTGKGRRVFPL